ncbi:MAG: diguanylate cyclase [Gallionella sp.]|nr:diguanylate cyclase [Gallionella sp.]
MKRWESGWFNTPLRIVIAVGVVVFSVEFLFMTLLHDVIMPLTSFTVSDRTWSIIDAVTLVVLVSPVLYLLVFVRMQRDFAELTQLFANLTDTLMIGVLLVDTDLRVHRWNQWLERKTGISSQQACGKLLTELFVDFNSPRLLSAIELCIKHKSPQLISQTLNRYVLPIPLVSPMHDLKLMQQQVSVAPLTNSRGETLAAISINDVTESVAKSSALARLAMKMESQSNRDQLTGAYNRHFLWSWLTPQLKQSVRHSQALSCLMLDIDFFKRINDTYGHDVGDAVLRGFAEILHEQMRDSDILVRYGGEEFVVLLTHADAAVALEIANRILDRVRKTAIVPLEVGDVRCSIGVSSWTPEEPCSAEELLKGADRRLYHAKHNGRDQVVIDSESPRSPR